MIWPEGFFTDGQGAAIEGLCSGVLPLIVQKQRQVVEAGGHSRMIWPEGFFTDGQGAAIEGLCSGVLPLFP